MLTKDQFMTPKKSLYQEFYTPFSAKFTTRKNISASKFYIDDQIAEVSQKQIDDALREIKALYASQGIDFEFDATTQDFIRLIHIFPRIQMLYTFPINDRVFQLFTRPALVLSSKRINSLPYINDISQIVNIRGLVNITYSQLYRRDSETILDTLKLTQIKQILYLDNIRECKYLLGSDFIDQHIICYNYITPISRIGNLQRIMKPSHTGPQVNLGFLKEFDINLKVKDVIFIDTETPHKLVHQLNKVKAEYLFKDQQSMGKFDELTEYKEKLLLKSDMCSGEVLVHVDFPYSIQEYLTCFGQHKLSVICLNKEQYIKKRNQLFFQIIEIDELNEIYKFLQLRDSIQYNELLAFGANNIAQLIHLLEFHKIIQIDVTIPLKCEIEIDDDAVLKSEYQSELIKLIKQNSRRILSRKQVRKLKQYIIDLQLLSQLVDRPSVELLIYLEDNFEVHCSDFMIRYRTLHDQNLIHVHQDIKDKAMQEISDLDIFFCLGQSLKSANLNKCTNFAGKQQKFKQFIERYLNEQEMPSIGSFFDFNQTRYLPVKQIDSIKEKNMIQASMKGCSSKREALKEVIRQFPYVDILQISSLYSVPREQAQRVQGWVVKKLKI